VEPGDVINLQVPILKILHNSCVLFARRHDLSRRWYDDPSK
jgi:hypothetical protein